MTSPAADPIPAPRGPEPAAHGLPARPRVVLIADDSMTVRSLARMELELAGYTVREASNGADAVCSATADPPDVILLDIEMPVMDGYEAIRALTADPRTADLPVVFLTGRTTTSDLVEGLALGAHDYLRKPPEPAELLARVAAAVRVKELQDELRRRYAELERMSRTDHLTGLHNRRHLEEQLHMLLAAARRHGHALSVLIVDIDHFKTVNDTVGHAGGDIVLREVARRLAVELRVEDMIGRWGGEEFLVLLPHTPATSSAILAERLRVAVSGSPVTGADVDLHVTVSIGGAGLHEVGESDLLVAADTELYAAKAAGRNRVLIHPG